MQKVQLRFVKDPLIREALEVEMKLFVLFLFFFFFFKNRVSFTTSFSFCNSGLKTRS